MPQLEPLNLRINGDSRGLSSALSGSRRDVSGFAGHVDQESDRIRQQLQSIGKAAALAIPAAIVGGAGFGLSLAGEAEQAQVAFRVLLGSASEAKALLEDLSEFSASTPFQFPDIRQAAQLLVAFGFSAEQVTTELQILGNLAAGTNQPIGELAELIGKARVQNQIFSEDLNQLTGRGINILDGLAARFGVAASEVKKLAADGKIQFADIQAVLESMALGSGQFAGLMEQQAETLNGSWSTFRDNLNLLASDIGELLIPAATEFTQGLTEVVQAIRSIDAETAQAAAEITAFAITFTATIALFPRLIALGAQLVAVLRSLAAGLSVAQALSGPQGWLSLAVGLGVAGAAVARLDAYFDDINAKQQESAEVTTKAAQAVDGLTGSVQAAAVETEKLSQEQEQWLKTAARFREQLATPEEKYAKSIEDLRLAVTEGGLEMDFFRRGVAAAADELARASTQADAFQKASVRLAGSASVIRQQFEFNAGVTPALQTFAQQRERESRVEEEVKLLNVVLAAKLDQVNGNLARVEGAVRAGTNSSKPPIDL